MKYWIMLGFWWTAAIMSESAYAGHLSKKVEGYEWGFALAMVVECKQEIAPSKLEGWKLSLFDRDGDWTEGLNRFNEQWHAKKYDCERLEGVAKEESYIWENYFEE